MLDAPEPSYARQEPRPRRTTAAPSRRLRRDFEQEMEEGWGDGEEQSLRRRGVAARMRSLLRTRWGQAGVAFAGLLVLGAAALAAVEVQRAVLHDPRFVIQTSDAISIVGNQHLTEAQLLSVFGGDVERNIFTVPLEERRAELERLPWVEHATVMRLLPDKLRIAVVERTPVAYVRQGSEIELVDRNGVLLETAPDEKLNYSFPVVTGVNASDPLSTRAARMAIYERFTSDLDSSGEHISATLSEVDLSDPEDVKALIADKGNAILVHFGEDAFLARYRKFQAHRDEWLAQFPKLSSVDMRYDRQAVLEMHSGVTAAAAPASSAAAGAAVPTAAAQTAPASRVTASSSAASSGAASSAAAPSSPVSHTATAKAQAAPAHVAAARATGAHAAGGIATGTHPVAATAAKPMTSAGKAVAAAKSATTPGGSTAAREGASTGTSNAATTEPQAQWVTHAAPSAASRSTAAPAAKAVPHAAQQPRPAAHKAVPQHKQVAQHKPVAQHKAGKPVRRHAAGKTSSGKAGRQSHPATAGH
ncbi:MAG: FtsQ-type POTRA domain-containing protein [Acidobacteriota bacterium]|nr:FtsQ-type POTRA domain-containing protein [Acidobacteriota bacterium]